MRFFSFRRLTFVGAFSPLVLQAQVNTPTAHRRMFKPCARPCVLAQAESEEVGWGSPFDTRRFLPGLGRGPAANIGYFHDSQRDSGSNWDARPEDSGYCSGWGSCLPAPASRYSHFAWSTNSSWKVAVAAPPERSQWRVSLRANIFPYGGMNFILDVAAHFPGGMSHADLVSALRIANAQGRAPEGRFRCNGQTVSGRELIESYGGQVFSALFPENVWRPGRDDSYSITVLNQFDGDVEQVSAEDWAALTMLGASDRALAESQTEPFEKSEYGMFKSDRCFVRRGGLVAYLPPDDGVDVKKRRKRLAAWLARPAELALVQRVAATSIDQGIREARGELIRAGRLSKAAANTLLRKHFVSADAVNFVNDLRRFQEGFIPGERKLHSLIARSMGTDRALASLDEDLNQLLDDEKNWTNPIREAAKLPLGLIRKALGG